MAFGLTVITIFYPTVNIREVYDSGNTAVSARRDSC